MTARNFTSVKLPTALVEAARKEAELFNRSLGGQIEHWARLGKALEGAPGASVDQVRETLEGRVNLRTLSRSEQEAVLDDMHTWLKNPTEDEAAAYASLTERPGAVGTDKNGAVVKGPLKSTLRKAG